MSSSCVSIECSAPAPASKALEALIKILGLNDCKLEQAASPTIKVTSKNPLIIDGDSTSVSATTWMGCARALCKQVPLSRLWGNDNLEESSLVEGWMESATMTLIPVLVCDKTDKIFNQSVGEFAGKLNAVFCGKGQKYLVGDTPTAADVCISLWLAQACDRLSMADLPKETDQWVKSLAKHPVLEGFYAPTEKKSAAAPATTSTAELSSDNFVVGKLKEYQIEHSSYMHTHCVTAEELLKNVPIAEPTESHTKNLFLRDKKHGLFLVSVLPSSQVNTKELGNMLNLKGKTNLRMADPAVLKENLGCEPGTVGPLAIANDTDGNVTIVIDAGLMQKSKIHSHPLRNDASIVLTPSALQDYIAKTNHEAVILEFEESSGSPTPAPQSKPAPKEQEKKKPEQKQKQKQKQKQEQPKKDIRW
mmetsp:Transcript_29815/g.45203  ORF Transcript_29815/g.45203 Transcript_29815/m.45203 type:complete len:419 (-) Transcript_29815:3137-4393(-)